MKIKRIKTLSFAISEEHERDIEKKFGKSAKKGILGIGIKENTNILRSYLPIARFEVTHIKNIGKGGISQKSEELIGNSFHTDLSSGEIYCIQRNRIIHYDILRKLLDLPPEAVQTLGYLFTHGGTYREELDPNAVLEIARRGLIRIFKPRMLQISSFIADEISMSPDGRKTQVKDRVKVAFHIPRFDYAGYNLSNFLTTTNTIVESYAKEPIKYSVEQISKTLEYFFDATVSLEAVIFLSSMRCEYIQKNQSKKLSGQEFPVCFLHEKITRYKEGVKLNPISLSTELLTEGSIPVESSTINFLDVAGLDEIKDEVRRRILYPLLKPETAKDFKIEGGGGILLYGPPGCGKTYIAKATIGECGGAFFNVNISDLIGSGVESGPKILREVFENARKNAPSIIFFDEIDSIGGKKGTAGYAERVIISQLLTEIDGLEGSKSDVLFIAATDSPWAIDPSLRRSGRFTTQIFIPPPDLKARVDIFKIYTKDRSISSDVDFQKLAELTNDYAAADIKAVCDAAAEIPWGEALRGGTERKITMSDFLKAIRNKGSSIVAWFKIAQKGIEKSGERDIYIDLARYILKYRGGIDQVTKPEINFSDVGNLYNVKEEIRKRIIYPIVRPDIAKDFEMGVGGGILLYGPPGCGKRYIAMATAGECNASFFNVNITDIISPLQEGESEKMIQEIFERASRNTPAIIFFDEIDAILGHKESVTGSEKRILAEFLTEMDGFIRNKGVMVIAATNSLRFLDPALRRSGRFTKQIFIPPPDLDTRTEIFKIHTKNRPLSGDIDFNKLAELTVYYSSADIKAVCDAAAEIPWGEALRGGTERKITMSDFMTAISSQKSSILSWFDRIKKDWGL